MSALIKKERLLFLMLLGASFVVKGQTKGGFIKSSRNNKPYSEVIFGIGAANFLGDVGGANNIGTHYSLADLNMQATRPSMQLCYRLKFKKRWAVKGGFYYNLVSGSDSYSTDIYRQNRNIAFKSNIFELSGQVEYYFTKPEIGDKSKQYKVKGAKGYKGLSGIQGYLFFGLGGFHFNPQAPYDGTWVALQPLSTEGEGLPGGPPKYSLNSVCIPLGIGFKQAITKEWSVGIEFGFRKTYTDYIDDVSGTYYNNAAILAAKGPVAAYLADPALYAVPKAIGGNSIPGENQTAAGQERGDPRNTDSYMFVNITVCYKLAKTISLKKK